MDTVLQHPDRVKSIAVVGPYVVTGASDDAIRVWDIAVSLLGNLKKRGVHKLN